MIKLHAERLNWAETNAIVWQQIDKKSRPNFCLENICDETIHKTGLVINMMLYGLDFFLSLRQPERDSFLKYSNIWAVIVLKPSFNNMLYKMSANKKLERFGLSA